jgi:7-carboxy-7-deazaguanine synthase
MIRLNDIYACIQGEGCLSGTPMALVRLQGCGVGCPFCDTKETWAAEPAHKVGSIAEALGTGPAWCEAHPDAVAAEARRVAGPNVRWALLTGGEPAEQQLVALATALIRRGFLVALETSGTAGGFLEAPLHWVCVSPKVDMPGNKRVLAAALAAADEIKMVIGKPADLDTLDALLAQATPKPGCQVCLQPASQSEKATRLCVETAMRRGWRVSLQLHKYLGVR